MLPLSLKTRSVHSFLKLKPQRGGCDVKRLGWTVYHLWQKMLLILKSEHVPRLQQTKPNKKRGRLMQQKRSNNNNNTDNNSSSNSRSCSKSQKSGRQPFVLINRRTRHCRAGVNFLPRNQLISFALGFFDALPLAGVANHC